MYKKVFCFSLAVFFTASMISSCKDGEDGKDGADGTSSIVSIVDCIWHVNGQSTGQSACGSTPTIEISPDGYWVINGVKTNVLAIGQEGPQGPSIGAAISIDEEGFWCIDGVSTGVSALGSQITIGPNGNWWIDGDDTGKPATGGGETYTTLTVTPSVIELDPFGDDATVTIETNAPEWSFVLDPPAASGWLTVVKEETELKLTAPANKTITTRSVIVKVSAGAIDRTINVSQEIVEPDYVNVTGTYLKNTTRPFTRLKDEDGNDIAATLPEGSTYDPQRWFHIADWITNEQGRINGNVDNALDNDLCLPANASDLTPPNQFRISDGKIYQTVELPAGRYKFDVTVRIKNPLHDVYIVVDTGDGLPDTGGFNEGPGDIANALAYYEIGHTTNIANNADVVLSVEFVLEEATTVSLGLVANVYGQQQSAYRDFKLWQDSNP